MAGTLGRLIDIIDYTDEATETQNALDEIFEETMTYVVSGAELICSCGGEGTLFIEEDDNAQMLTGIPIAQEDHGVANENILIEGKCTSTLHPSAIAAGSKRAESYDCAVEISNPLWLICKENALIGEKPALTQEHSVILCDYGGMISLESNGQGDEYDEGMQEEILLMVIEKTLKILFDSAHKMIAGGMITSEFDRFVNKNVFYVIQKLLVGAANKDFQVNSILTNNGSVADLNNYIPSIYILMFVAGFEGYESEFYYPLVSEKVEGIVTFGFGSASGDAKSLAEKLSRYSLFSQNYRNMLIDYIQDGSEVSTVDIITRLGIDPEDISVKDDKIVREGSGNIVGETEAVFLYLMDAVDHIPSDLLTLLSDKNVSLTQSQIDALFSINFNGKFVNPSESPDLTSALANNNLKEASKEITERSNGGEDEGIQKRREAEGNIFDNGIYSNG